MRLTDAGTLAGSVLTMNRVLANLVALWLPLAEAARRCATLPAAYLGLDDRGRTEPGVAADLVVVDAVGRVVAVLAKGHSVAGAG